MCVRLSNHSCTFCNPGQWVARKSVRSVTTRWEREQPWSSSPLGSVIIWAALRWELGSCRPLSTSSALLGRSLKPHLITPDSLSLITNPVNQGPDLFVAELSKIVCAQTGKSSYSTPSLCFFKRFTLIVDPSWVFTWVWSPASEQWFLLPVFVIWLSFIPSFFSFCAHTIKGLLPVLCLWTWTLGPSSFNCLSSSLTLPSP